MGGRFPNRPCAIRTYGRMVCFPCKSLATLARRASTLERQPDRPCINAMPNDDYADRPEALRPTAAIIMHYALCIVNYALDIRSIDLLADGMTASVALYSPAI